MNESTWMDKTSGPLRRSGAGLSCALLLWACGPVGPPPQSQAPDARTDYGMYVTNESADVVTYVSFAPGTGFTLERVIPVGVHPTELSAPHGVATSPDGTAFYVTLAHGRSGTPFGSLRKFDAATDTLLGSVRLGRFPASLDIAPDGEHVFVANFNVHGDHVPSDMSVVHTSTMEEVARPLLCVMPHGMRVSPEGTRVYTVCMHSEQLVAVDARSFEIAGRFSVRPGHEAPLDPGDTGGDAPHAHHTAAPAPTAADPPACRPTWASPASGERSHLVYVPCNGNREVLEIDTRDGKVLRRFATGSQPYNTAVSPDARILGVTLRGDQGVMFFDLDTGAELARLRTTEPITHGIVFSDDGRFAFVTNEGIGSDPGTLEAIDTRSFERVSSIELYLQPTGIDLRR